MFRYALLGLVQGLTEFLPISSSAHLVLLQSWLGIAEPAPIIVAFLHLGTFLALLIFFRVEIRWLLSALTPHGREARRYLGYVLIGLAPTVTAALIFGSAFTEAFSSSKTAAALLFVTSLILFASDRLKDGKNPFPSRGKAFLIGLGQAAGILPGISRSGITVFIGVLVGLSRAEAFRFSFLLAIPTFVGAAVFSGVKAMPENSVGLAVGAFSAFISGLPALWAFRRLLLRQRLWPLALYCLALGIAGLISG